jgi:hypothetical protein
MNKSRYYKNIGDFYKTEEKNKDESTCLNYFIRREDNDPNVNIKNIDDINNVNIKKNIDNNKDIKVMNYQPFQYHQNNNHKENYNMNMQNYTTIEKLDEKKDKIEIIYETKKVKSTSSPDVFGPPMWFTLHNGASKYPDNPSPITKQRMKYFIIGLPVMIPCANCREHATSYIEKNMPDLDRICNNRTNLFNFFVDFHNYVNERLNKPLMCYSDAEKLYNGEAEIKKINYK